MAEPIRIRRDLPDWLFNSEAKLKWYIDLLMMASPRSTKSAIKGQVDMTIRQLAKRWNTTTPTTSDFLKRLDAEDMVILLKVNGGTLQKALQQPLQVFVREISELRKDALQRALQEALQKQKLKLQIVSDIDNIESNNGIETQKEEEKVTQKEDENINKNKEINNNNLLFTKKEESERYSKFKLWIQKNTPWCYKNLKMITEVEFYKLLKDFSSEQIADTMLQLENYSRRSNYKSIYLTLLKWMKRDNGTL